MSYNFQRQNNWTPGFQILRETVTRWLNGGDMCSPVEELSGLRTGLNYFANGLSVAEQVAYFSRRGAPVIDRLRRARHCVCEVAGGLETLADICNDLRSLRKIKQGIAALQRIGVIQNDPAGAAVAFGQVFSGLGELSRHLDPPASSYADFLAESGTFFSDMRDGIGLGPADRRARREGVHWAQPPETSVPRGI